MKPNDSSLQRLEASRQRAEALLGELRGSLRREVGWAPQRRSWILLTLALSSGVALAFLWKGRRGKGQSS